MGSRSSASRGQVSCGHRAKSDRHQARALDRTGGLVQFVGNRFRTVAPLKRKGPGYGVPDRVGEWLEWRQVAQTWENTNDKSMEDFGGKLFKKSVGKSIVFSGNLEIMFP